VRVKRVPPITVVTGRGYDDQADLMRGVLVIGTPKRTPCATDDANGDSVVDENDLQATIRALVGDPITS